jgi:hypothetical protein
MESVPTDVCVPNISPRERKKRLASGLIMFVIAIGVLAGLVIGGISPWWRLGLFPLFVGAAAGVFQWSDKT